MSYHDDADGEQHSNVTSLDQARKKRQAQQRTGVRVLAPMQK